MDIVTYVLIRFPIIAQRSKGAYYFHRVVGLEVINIRKCIQTIGLYRALLSGYVVERTAFARCYVPWKFRERNPLITLRTMKICTQRNAKSNTKLYPNLNFNFNSNGKTHLNRKTNPNLNLQKTLKKLEKNIKNNSTHGSRTRHLCSKIQTSYH